MAMTMPQGLRLEPMVEDIQRLLKVGARIDFVDPCDQWLGEPLRRTQHRGAVSGYLSTTAVAAISTRNSGLTKPACTHARAGGFSGKYDP